MEWNLVAAESLVRRQDRTRRSPPSRAHAARQRGGLVAYGLTITSRRSTGDVARARVVSTIFGVLIIGGQGLAAISFLVLTIAWLSRRAARGIIWPIIFHDAEI